MAENDPESAGRKRPRLRAGLLSVLKWGLVGLVVAFLLIQALPFGRSHTNPAVHSEPPWDSPRTRELAIDACYDCHSNRTEWPWYSYIAPMSWLVEYDVYKGRDDLNFSEWERYQEKWREKAERERLKELERLREGKKPKKEKPPSLVKVVLEGEMPLWYYVIAHPDADLSEAEKQELAQGLARTFDLDDGR